MLHITSQSRLDDPSIGLWSSVHEHLESSIAHASSEPTFYIERLVVNMLRFSVRLVYTAETTDHVIKLLGRCRDSMRAHCVASHRIASHRITSHHITSHRIACHLVTSHCIKSHIACISHHITSHAHRIASPCVALCWCVIYDVLSPLVNHISCTRNASMSQFTPLADAMCFVSSTALLLRLSAPVLSALAQRITAGMLIVMKTHADYISTREHWDICFQLLLTFRSHALSAHAAFQGLLYLLDHHVMYQNFSTMVSVFTAFLQTTVCSCGCMYAYDVHTIAFRRVCILCHVPRVDHMHAHVSHH